MGGLLDAVDRWRKLSRPALQVSATGLPSRHSAVANECDLAKSLDDADNVAVQPVGVKTVTFTRLAREPPIAIRAFRAW